MNNMAKIFLKLVKTDPILISNDRAKNLIKEKEKFEHKEIENEWMDVENFHGYLSDIRSIVLDADDSRSSTPPPESKPMTDEELKQQKLMMAKVRKNVFGK